MSKEKQIELKPCPFCGGKAEIKVAKHIMLTLFTHIVQSAVQQCPKYLLTTLFLHKVGKYGLRKNKLCRKLLMNGTGD